MTVQKMYRYIGVNGILTTSVLLQGIDHTPMATISAAPGKLITNGTITAKYKTVFASDVDLWTEIDDPNYSEDDII